MKLAQIPKETPPAEPSKPAAAEEVRPLEEALTSEDDSIHVYGLSPSDPDYAEEVKRLRALKRRDPELFKKMQSLD